MAICDRDCEKCSRLNIKVDKLGYPWGYECKRLKFSHSKKKLTGYFSVAGVP